MWSAGPAGRVPGGTVHGALDLRLHLEAGMTVGLFGGSFDPPHDGHVHVARTALKRLGLDRIVWLVSPGNPLKGAAPGDYRRRVAAAVRLADGPRIEVSTAEAALGTRFTIDTVRAFKARWPRVRFVWIMGADSLLDFHRWRGWTELLAEIPVAVIARPGSTIRSRLAPAARRFGYARIPARAARRLSRRAPPAWTFLDAPWNYTSSTALRAQADPCGLATGP